MYVEKLQSGIQRLARPPRYMKPHRAHGINSKGETEWNEPEAVHGRSIHRPSRGKVSTIRHVPEFYQAKLAVIDVERATINARLAELRKEESDLCEMAFAEGKPLTIAEIKNGD